MIVPPKPALEPVIPPFIVPIVQVKLLGVLEVNEILGPLPLQVFALALLVTEGEGLTVTVTAVGAPAQESPVEAGVTKY